MFKKRLWHSPLGTLFNLKSFFMKTAVRTFRAQTWVQNPIVLAVGRGFGVFLASVCKFYVPWTPVAISLLPQACLRLGFVARPGEVLKAYGAFLAFDALFMPVSIMFRPGVCGFAVGCAVVPTLLSWARERFHWSYSEKTFWALLANVPILLCGVLGMMATLGLCFEKAWAVGVVPYIFLDAAKTVLMMVLFV